MHHYPVPKHILLEPTFREQIGTLQIELTQRQAVLLFVFGGLAVWCAVQGWWSAPPGMLAITLLALVGGSLALLRPNQLPCEEFVLRYLAFATHARCWTWRPAAHTLAVAPEPTGWADSATVVSARDQRARPRTAVRVSRLPDGHRAPRGAEQRGKEG